MRSNFLMQAKQWQSNFGCIGLQLQTPTQVKQSGFFPTGDFAPYQFSWTCELLNSLSGHTLVVLNDFSMGAQNGGIQHQDGVAITSLGQRCQEIINKNLEIVRNAAVSLDLKFDENAMNQDMAAHFSWLLLEIKSTLGLLSESTSAVLLVKGDPRPVNAAVSALNNTRDIMAAFAAGQPIDLDKWKLPAEGVPPFFSEELYFIYKQNENYEKNIIEIMFSAGNSINAEHIKLLRYVYEYRQQKSQPGVPIDPLNLSYINNVQSQFDVRVACQGHTFVPPLLQVSETKSDDQAAASAAKPVPMAKLAHNKPAAASIPPEDYYNQLMLKQLNQEFKALLTEYNKQDLFTDSNLKNKYDDDCSGIDETMERGNVDEMLLTVAGYFCAPAADPDLEVNGCFDWSDDQNCSNPSKDIAKSIEMMSRHIIPLMACQQVMLDALDWEQTTGRAFIRVIAIFQIKLMDLLLLLIPEHQSEVCSTPTPYPMHHCLNQSNAIAERIEMMSCFQVLHYLMIQEYDGALTLFASELERKTGSKLSAAISHRTLTSDPCKLAVIWYEYCYNELMSPGQKELAGDQLEQFEKAKAFCNATELTYDAFRTSSGAMSPANRMDASSPSEDEKQQAEQKIMEQKNREHWQRDRDRKRERLSVIKELGRDNDAQSLVRVCLDQNIINQYLKCGKGDPLRLLIDVYLKADKLVGPQNQIGIKQIKGNQSSYEVKILGSSGGARLYASHYYTDSKLDAKVFVFDKYMPSHGSKYPLCIQQKMWSDASDQSASTDSNDESTTKAGRTTGYFN